MYPFFLSEVLTYNVMGNIQSLNRDGTGANAYTYKNGGKSNQLLSMANVSGMSYVYDANGNATTDGTHYKTITYNYLNLPQTVNGGLSYIYDATGKKLQKLGPAGIIEYNDGIQYTNGVIDFIQTGEGIALNSGGSYSYRYNLTDHLGNVRVTFKESSGTVDIVERMDYYAFGLRKAASPNTNFNRYLYNGKELQDELKQYDYGARFYDPIIGRWNVIDPMAEKYYGITPYAYSINLPSTLVDPDGRDVDVSNLTDDEHKKALVEFLKTKNGQGFIARYLGKGQSFTIKIGKNSYVYTGKVKGEFANDVLAFGSSDNLGQNEQATVLGRTLTTKPDGKQLDQDGYGGKDNEYDVRGKTVEQIWLRKGQDIDKAVSTLGHEAFVHGLPDQNRIRELRQELNDGKIQPGTKQYEMKLQAITRSGDVDHKNLGIGKAGTFMIFSQQMDVIKSTTKFIKSYNQDVKENK